MPLLDRIVLGDEGREQDQLNIFLSKNRWLFIVYSFTDMIDINARIN